MRKNSRLRPFVMYLDPDEDAQLIAHLEKAVQKHRASEEMRRLMLMALEGKTAGYSYPALLPAALPPLPEAVDQPLEMPSQEKVQKKLLDGLDWS